MKKDDFEIVPKLDIPGRRVLTVIFSADDAYVAPAGIAVTSLLDTISPDVFCDVVILDNGITPENRDLLLQITADSSAASIRFFDVSHIAADAPIHGYFSKATYLSLFVPYLFRTHEKVLFLDSDMIVRKDVSELFDSSFSHGEYLAAARDIGMAELVRGNAPMVFKKRRTNWRRYAARYFGLSVESIEEAFNSGMLLYNIPAFVEDDFSVLRGMTHHIRFGYFLVDQCVANILFKGHVKFLHLRWNHQVQHHGTPRLIDWFARQYQESEADPSIIHYVTPRKPWRQCQIPFAEEFWAVAGKTVWFQQMQESRLTEGFMRWLNQPVEPAPGSVSAEPIFSFIMPVYNRERSIRRAIRSIQRQDFSDFEIIVIDDASTDATAEVVRKLASTDPRIRLICLENNQGPGRARNVAVAQARGNYIGICDSDDFILPGALAAFARQIAEHEYDVVAGNQYRWLSRRRVAAGDNGTSAIRRNVTVTRLKELPEFWTLVHFHRCVFRRAFLQENGIEYPPIRRVEDPAYLADVLPKAQSFSIIQTPVYLFHVRPRQYELTEEEIGDAYTGYELIREKMTTAGYEEFAFFFHCFFSPVWLAYNGLSDEVSLELAARLKKIMEPIPDDLLDHPFMQHPQLDANGFRHDLLVVKNSTPEQIVELMNRGMFCGMGRLHKAELRQLRDTIRQLRGTLQKLEPMLRVLRVARRMVRRLERALQPRIRRMKQTIRRRRVARFRKWKADGNG